MSKFVVIVFPNETQAYQGVRAMKELHAEGSLTLYSMAVVVKDAEGKLAIKDAAEKGPLGTAVGALAGGLVGVVGGPVGMLAGSFGGTLVGSLFDIANYGVSADFVAKVSSELTFGKSAVVAEIVESWTTPLDTRMEPLGGVVLRTWRADFEDEQIAKQIAAEKADWEQPARRVRPCRRRRKGQDQDEAGRGESQPRCDEAEGRREAGSPRQGAKSQGRRHGAAGGHRQSGCEGQDQPAHLGHAFRLSGPLREAEAGLGDRERSPRGVRARANSDPPKQPSDRRRK